MLISLVLSTSLAMKQVSVYLIGNIHYSDVGVCGEAVVEEIGW